VRNSLNPLTPSAKETLKNKDQIGKIIIDRPCLSNRNLLNGQTIIKRKTSETYNINKNNIKKPNSMEKIMINPKILSSFYSYKPLQFKKLNNNSFKPSKESFRNSSGKKPQRNRSCKNINYGIKNKKLYLSAYKEYLSEKNKIELDKKAKEIEMNYVIESRKQQQMKLENDIKNKFQGYDFSKQKERGFFLSEYLKSKQYTKEEVKKKKRGEGTIFKEFDFQNFIKKLNFEVNEKKYLFLDNKDFIPRIHYSNFNTRIRKFFKSLRENPNYNYLNNHIPKH
jgi:hypothetical protein